MSNLEMTIVVRKPLMYTSATWDIFANKRLIFRCKGKKRPKYLPEGYEEPLRV